MIMRLLCQLPMQNIWIFDKIVDGFKIKCLQPWTIRSNKIEYLNIGLIFFSFHVYSYYKKQAIWNGQWGVNQ